MEIRLLKTTLVGFVALLGFLYAGQNLINLDEAYFFVAMVSGMEGHSAYPSSLGPPVQSSFLIWLALGIILLGEITTGLLAAKGTWDLWQARKAPAGKFNAAKKYAILGCGMALIVWFGLFAVIGGAYFQMWQTEMGSLSLEGAFQYAGASGIVLLFVNMADN